MLGNFYDYCQISLACLGEFYVISMIFFHLVKSEEGMRCLTG